LCTEGSPEPVANPGGQSLFALRVVYPDQGRAATALRAPIAAGPLASPGTGGKGAGDVDDGSYVRLIPTVAPDGMSIIIDDDPRRTCAEALAKAKSDHASDEAVYVIRVVCGARGRYNWTRSGRFGFDLVEQPRTWLATHGVTSVPRRIDFDMGCEPITIGRPSREGILCKGPPEVPKDVRPEQYGGQSTFPLIVVYADQGIARIALDVPYAAGPEDTPLGPHSPQSYEPDTDKYVSLVETLAADGMSLMLDERPRATCAKRIAEAQAQNASKDLNGALTPAIHAMKIACGARGNYEWRAGTFVRARD
jgi:hypothetical protein